jgi:hypothetical protein
VRACEAVDHVVAFPDQLLQQRQGLQRSRGRHATRVIIYWPLAAVKAKHPQPREQRLEESGGGRGGRIGGGAQFNAQGAQPWQSSGDGRDRYIMQVNVK